MAETKKKVEGEYLQYQGKPLVREENTIIYGDLTTIRLCWFWRSFLIKAKRGKRCRIR